eukprot:m.111029 g.111029  ORF g.111029 m.111029 type:complete len:52 (+) comp14053_c0_seq11:75-230(+)
MVRGIQNLKLVNPQFEVDMSLHPSEVSTYTKKNHHNEHHKTWQTLDGLMKI